MIVLPRLWRSRRARASLPRSAVGLFSDADRCRREGRYAEAAQLVARGLMVEPASVMGHLLAAYLHVALRTMEPARREFQWVLARDPSHPRALLGMARLALEASDVEGCRDWLVRALRAYPDFPEAQALLEGLATVAPAPPVGTYRPALERLRVPAVARALLVLGADGAVIAARPVAAETTAPRIARAAGLAGAALARGGLGALRRAVVEDTDVTYFVRAHPAFTLALALPRGTHITHGMLEVNRLWAAAQHELAVARDAEGVVAAQSARRVS
jgi:hypothetical protein